MKKTILSILSVCLLLTACMNQEQQTITYNTLYSVEKTTVAAYDTYIDLVIKGYVTTNSVPKVSKAFNVYQLAFVAALDTAQFNTNAIAPANIIVLSQDVINLINEVNPQPTK